MLEDLLLYLKNGLVEGAIYALIALGYTMVYGILGMINFAHGEVYMVGGYAGILGIGILMSTGVVAASVPVAILLAFLFGMVVCAVYGATMERVAYRPLRNAPVLSPLISAIGASFFLWNFVMVCQGNLPKRVPGDVRKWLVETKLDVLGDVRVSVLEIGIFVTAVLMMAGLQLFIHRTRLGKAMRATAQDRTMASLVGIPINKVITATFVIGSALAAVAGIMLAMYVSVMLFLDGYIPGMKAFTAAVLGGIGNVPGAMIGGFTLGIAENLAMWEGSAGGVLDLVLALLALSAALRFLPGPSFLRWIAAPALAGGVLFLKGYYGIRVPVVEPYLEDVILTKFMGRADYKHVYAFVILILFLIFRPRGILGERVSEKV